MSSGSGGGSAGGGGGTAMLVSRPRSITGSNSDPHHRLLPSALQPPPQQQQLPPSSSSSSLDCGSSEQQSQPLTFPQQPPTTSSSSSSTAGGGTLPSSHHHHNQQHHHHQLPNHYGHHHHQQQQQHQQQQPQPRMFNKSSFFTNNPNHNNGGGGPNSNNQSGYHHHHYGGGGGGPAGYCSGADGGGGGPTLPHKAGPAYFNFSRQRYTPYYSRSFSNNSANNMMMDGGGGGGGGYCRNMQPPLQQPPPPPQAASLHNTSMPPPPSGALLNTTCDSGFSSNSYDADGSHNQHNVSLGGLSAGSGSHNNSSLMCASGGGPQQQQPDNSVTLQISNIDTSIEDRALKHYLLGKLKPLTPIMSFAYEGLSMVKIRVPSQHHAKQVVSYLHRKKIGHKRITVSYTRDSSTMEPSTLRCQVAGLLKDIPFYKLSMYKFRELFQSRFKTSISVMDLYDMKDICTIAETANEEKFISLRPELISSIENSELLGCLQLSVPYCTAHFKSGHRGWAELEIEPLPNVYMTVAAVRSIVYDLLKKHKGDIPIASLVYCVEAELGVQIERNESGVNLEHLISCVNGVHITTNKFGIKILSWLAANSVINGKGGANRAYEPCGNNAQNNSSMTSSGNSLMGYGGDDGMHAPQQQQPPPHMMMMGNRYTKFANVADPFGQISREIVELVKMSPKSTMKFSRFIPAYHNHFGKQCRVADYGYTKLIELFEALNGIVQIMGDGENRQITLTHKCQIRCFTSDILRLLRTQPNKAMPMAHMAALFSSTQARKFEITDYGVCDMEDIMESLVRNNVVCLERSSGAAGSDMCVVAIPKRRQTRIELQKTCVFAGEVVELFRNSSQYSIPFEKFACSYHYNYGYQCRLSDYGFLKLTDLMEAITGVVEIEVCNDEDRKVYLSPKVAQRVFAEQLRDLTKMMTASSITPMNLSTLLFYHKKQFGYQMQPQSLGIGTMWYAIKDLPYVELTGTTASDDYIVICHHDDPKFVFNGYAACRVVLESGKWAMPITNFIDAFFGQYAQIINEHMIEAMNHALEIFVEYGTKYVRISPLMIFVLRIISVLEMMNIVSVNDLKSILNIGISDCFPYGYPNFTSLLQAFGDIFISSSTVINDMSEIVLNKQCQLAKNGVQEFLRGGAPPMEATALAAGGFAPRAGRMPPMIESAAPVAKFDGAWDSDERALSSKYSSSAPPGMPINVSAALAQQQHAHQLRMVGESAAMGDADKLAVKKDGAGAALPTSLAGAAEKEDFFFNTMQSSDFDITDIEKLFFQKTALTEQPSATSTSRVPLYERKPSDEWLQKKSLAAADEKSSSTDSSPSSSADGSQLFDPAKPDTPPSNVPFWMDPVWRHDSPSSVVDAAPLSESLNIALPELKTIDELPALDTPTTMKGLLEHNDSMFSFEF